MCRYHGTPRTREAQSLLRKCSGHTELGTHEDCRQTGAGSQKCREPATPHALTSLPRTACRGGSTSGKSQQAVEVFISPALSLGILSDWLGSMSLDQGHSSVTGPLLVGLSLGSGNNSLPWPLSTRGSKSPCCFWPWTAATPYADGLCKLPPYEALVGLPSWRVRFISCWDLGWWAL